MSVIRDLQQAPEEFSFLQTLRLLERHHREKEQRTDKAPLKTRIASGVDFRPPSQEPVRFHGQHSLAFPRSEVEHITREQDRWQLQANFIGLDGALGPLPFHYTELLQERHKAKDPALMQFLDLFNHRTTTLFGRAASKYKLPLQYERARRHSGDRRQLDRHTEVLLSLIGLSPRLLRDRGTLPAEALIYYGGLLSQQVKTAANLQQIIQGYFDVPVAVEEFSGTWCEVLPSMRCQLPSLEEPKGQNNSLGRSTLLGQNSWLAQNKVAIKLGPLNKEQYQRFAPGSRSLESLNELSSLYLGTENQFDFELKVQAQEMPRDLQLKGGEQAHRLGWDSRLPASIYRPVAPDETLDIPVSTHRLPHSSQSAEAPAQEEGRNAA